MSTLVTDESSSRDTSGRRPWVTTTLVLDQLRNLDDEAWQLFDQRFRAPIVRFARKLSLESNEAEDVAQETLISFVEAFREGRYDRERGRLSSWLFGIAYRKVLRARRNRVRDHKQGAPQPTVFWEEQEGEDEAERQWELAWKQSILRKCLEQVRNEVQERTYRAFELVALQGKDPAQVADDLGITRNAVFIAKHRVLKRVRELQEELEDDA
jgi:RNA polymerase sigma factor (sigma-70 family)